MASTTIEEEEKMNDSIEHDITDLLDKIKNEALHTHINALLPEVLKVVQAIINKIAICKTIKEADYYFDLFDKIQFVLDPLIFADDIDVSQELIKFVKDCERLDDPWLRDYLFTKIKSGEYNLASDEFL